MWRGSIFGLNLWLAVAVSVAAEDPRRRGPLEWREEFLLAQSRTTLAPVQPDLLASGVWRFDIGLGWGNDFGWDQDVAGEAPRDRRFLIDGEHRSVDMVVSRGLGGEWEAQLQVPLRWRGGGFWDGLIDWWHGVVDGIGLPDNGRSFFDRDLLRVAGRDSESRPVAWEGRPGSGFGNVELGLRRRVLGAAPRAPWTIVSEVRVTLPTTTGAFSARGIDLATQTAVARRLGERWDLYFGVGAVRAGATRHEGLDYTRFRGSGYAAIEWQIGRRLSLIAQVEAATRLVTSLAAYPAAQSYLRFGARLDVGERWEIQGGFEENLFDQQSTVDVGIRLGLTRR